MLFYMHEFTHQRLLRAVMIDRKRFWYPPWLHGSWLHMLVALVKHLYMNVFCTLLLNATLEELVLPGPQLSSMFFFFLLGIFTQMNFIHFFFHNVLFKQINEIRHLVFLSPLQFSEVRFSDWGIGLVLGLVLNDH